MFSKNTLRVVEFLLRSSMEQYNINQVAREVRISPAGSYKILKNLEKNGILVSKKLGNAIYYSLDLSRKETQSLCELVLIENRKRVLDSNSYAKVYAGDMKDAEKFSSILILFGSILENKKFRDVDVLFIVTKKDVKKVNDFCLKLSSVRPRQVTPLMMTEGDLKNNIRNKDKVVLDILRKGVVLHGEDRLIKLIGSV